MPFEMKSKYYGHIQAPIPDTTPTVWFRQITDPIASVSASRKKHLRRRIQLSPKHGLYFVESEK